MTFINKISKFFPNQPVSNDEMEEYLGKIKGLRSKAKNIVLRNNGITNRYYALTKEGEITHSVEDMAVEAIMTLEKQGVDLQKIDLLTSGTASPDIQMPSLSCMVHGRLGIGAIDAMSATGSCNSTMWALNYAHMSILTGGAKHAVCVGSENMSSWMMSKNFEEESAHLQDLGENGYVAFEKEFLRWMLSDGAAAVLLEDKPNEEGISLKLEWMEIKSYAHLSETCMYAGGLKDETGRVRPWRSLDQKDLLEKSVFSLKQDSKLLEKYITKFGGKFLSEILKKHDFSLDEIDYFMPHISSMFFKKHINQSLVDEGLNIPDEKWFLNLPKVGNVASASGFIMLEELFNSGKLVKGQRILLMIPESARFSYTYALLTVV